MILMSCVKPTSPGHRWLLELKRTLPLQVVDREPNPAALGWGEMEAGAGPSGAGQCLV